MSRTPGLWAVREAYSSGEPCGFVVHSGAINICDVESRDDADMIAAAPDLCAACDAADTAFAVLNISELTPQARGCVREAWPLVQAAKAMAMPGSIYAEVVHGVRENKIAELDRANAALFKALSDLVSVINLDSDQEYFICAEASDIVEAAQQAVIAAGGSL